MVDPIKLLQEARNLGSQATLADVQAAIGAVDGAPIEAAERARYQVEIWNEESPLAGQPPSYWRSRGDWPIGGKVYCIRVDGHLAYVQPHDPQSAGFIPMDEQTALARAEAAVAARVEEAVDALVKEQVLLQLL